MSYFFNAPTGLQPKRFRIINTRTGEVDIADEELDDFFTEVDMIIGGVKCGRLIDKRYGWVRFIEKPGYEYATFDSSERTGKERDGWKVVGKFRETNVKEMKMKLEVYKEAKEEEKSVCLDLVSGDIVALERTSGSDFEIGRLRLEELSRSIHLVAKDSSGKIISSIVVFKPDGTFVLCEGVDKSLGFQLDVLGRIMERE